MQYCLRPSVAGQNADVLVMKFGPPASTFKMNSGDTSYIWQLGNQTNIVADRGTGVATTQFCKVSVIANKNGIVTQLNIEDANAGGGLYALNSSQFHQSFNPSPSVEVRV